MKIIDFFGGLTMFRNLFLLTLTLLFSTLFVVGNVSAATMKIVELPATGTDAAIDISSEKTYTHTFDFGSNDPVTLNGVAFEQVVEGVEIKGIEIFEATSSQGFGYSLQDTRFFLPNPNYKFWLKNHEGGEDIDEYCDGKSHELFNDFLYFDRAEAYIGEGIIVTLKDLEANTAYSVRYYYRSWDPPIERPIIMYGDAESDSVFKDSIWVDIDTSRLGAQYIDYSFTTDDKDVVLKFLFQAEKQGPHLYGLTCEKLPQTGVGGNLNTEPSTYELGQIRLNMSDETVQFQISKNEHVTITVYNSVGQKMATLVDGFKDTGTYSVDLKNSHFSSGVYFCTMETKNKSIDGKFFIQK